MYRKVLKAIRFDRLGCIRIYVVHEIIGCNSNYGYCDVRITQVCCAYLYKKKKKIYNNFKTTVVQKFKNGGCSKIQKRRTFENLIKLC